MDKHCLISWGLGCEGVLGNHSALDEQGISKPIRVHGMHFSHVSCGAFHSVGISEGKLYSWGRSGCGRLGYEAERDHIDVPTKIQSGTLESVYFVQVSCGAHHTLALGDNGNIYAFGSGFSGQCGQGNRVDLFEPTLVQAESKFIFISAGYYHSMAIDGNNQIWSWGTGQKGQLGHGVELKWQPKPKKIVFSENSKYKFKFIASGELNSLAITIEGDILAWGSNMCGQLCNGKTDKKHVTSLPSPINNPKRITFKYACLGINHAFSISDQNELFFWGRSLTNTEIFTSLTEIPSPTGVRFVSVATSPHHAIAITDKGGLLSWGAGFYGQLGHSENNTCTEPKYVPNLKNVIAASCGTYFSMILATMESNSNNCEDEDTIVTDSPNITPRSNQKSGKEKIKSPLKLAMQKRSSPRNSSPVRTKSPKKHHRSSNKSSPDTPARKKNSVDTISPKTFSDSGKVSVSKPTSTLSSSTEMPHTGMFNSIRTQTDSIINIAAADILEDDNEVRPYRSLSARIHTNKYNNGNNNVTVKNQEPQVTHTEDRDSNLDSSILTSQEIKEKLQQLALEEKALREHKARIREALHHIQEKRKKLLQLL